VLGYLGATFTFVGRHLLLLDHVVSFMHLVNLHCLIHFVLNDLSRGRFHVFERDGWLFRSALRLEVFALCLDRVNRPCRKSFPHVLIALVFLVY